jgi:hypothetical protein
LEKVVSESGRYKKHLALVWMLRTHAFRFQQSVPWLFLVWPMPFTLLHIMSVAHYSNNSQKDLEAQPHLLMLHGVVVLLELFLAACKLCHMFLSQLVVIMATQIISAVTTAVLTILLLKSMANLMDTRLNHRLLYQCTTGARRQLATEVSDPSSHSKRAM